MLASRGYPALSRNASEDSAQPGLEGDSRRTIRTAWRAAPEPVSRQGWGRDVAPISCCESAAQPPAGTLFESEWFLPDEFRGKSLAICFAVGRQCHAGLGDRCRHSAQRLHHSACMPAGAAGRDDFACSRRLDGSSFVDVPTAEIVQIEPDLNAPAAPEKSSGDTCSPPAAAANPALLCNGAAAHPASAPASGGYCVRTP